MSRRIRSLELMKTLSSFVATNIIAGEDARRIVEQYKAGDDAALLQFIHRPDLPMTHMALVRNLRQFVG